MISISNGKRVEYIINIHRFKCTCGHTHAILPDILIPYGSYSLRFILTVLCDYLIRHCSVEEFCTKYHIVKSTLYCWIHMFIDHFNLLSGILKSIDVLTSEALAFIYSYDSLPKEFWVVSKFDSTFL